LIDGFFENGDKNKYFDQWVKKTNKKTNLQEFFFVLFTIKFPIFYLPLCGLTLIDDLFI
jgi:hypothetical protein